MLRDDVAILGGNDNTDEHHELLDAQGVEAFTLPLPEDYSHANVVARQDEAHGYWTIFNRDNGTKVRFSFENVKAKGAVEKSTYPELVDVKITDFCTSGCAYCYQGSTPEGKHASMKTLGAIASALGRMEVFEVALGGGEPTEHPDFVQVLKAFKQYNVVPNFTTRSTEWLKKPEVVEAVRSLVGGVAFSVSTAKDVERVQEALEASGLKDGYDYRKPRINVQYVMGSTPLDMLKDVVRAAQEARFQLVLLGYKTTGRGAEFEPYMYEGWYDTVRKAIGEQNFATIGIDTALAAEIEKDEKLKARVYRAHTNENEVLADRVYEPMTCVFYTVREGAFSMYIDAVALRMGPSSYCESLRMRPLPGRWERDYGNQDKDAKVFAVAYNLHEDIKEAFARW